MKQNVNNMEHYRNEILELAKDGNSFCLIDGKIEPCSGCLGCAFYPENRRTSCDVFKTLWLMEDYKEPITLTAREKHFVEFAEYGWLARDMDDTLYYYSNEPNKLNKVWDEDFNGVEIDKFDYELFRFITWEDEKPWSVENLRKLKVKEQFIKLAF